MWPVGSSINKLYSTTSYEIPVFTRRQDYNNKHWSVLVFKFIAVTVTLITENSHDAVWGYIELIN